nr:metallophosphoesterase [Haloferula sp. BvORR071]
MQSLKKGLVVSDLHLFSARSSGEKLLEDLSPILRRVDLLVLNGDTFDFRWSTLASEHETLVAARWHLERWLKLFEGREIHYVIGNHDCLVGHCAILAEMAAASETLKVHEREFVLGDSLFLHGDCANRGMSPARLDAYREAWSRDRQRGAVGRGFYRVVDATGAGLMFHRVYFPQAATVARVSGYLDQALPQWREGIRNCYFGHTHMPFRDHEVGGVRFHNTGSGTRGMGFNPLEFEIP